MDLQNKSLASCNIWSFRSWVSSEACSRSMTQRSKFKYKLVEKNEWKHDVRGFLVDRFFWLIYICRFSYTSHELLKSLNHIKIQRGIYIYMRHQSYVICINSINYVDPFLLREIYKILFMSKGILQGHLDKIVFFAREFFAYCRSVI